MSIITFEVKKKSLCLIGRSCDCDLTNLNARSILILFMVLNIWIELNCNCLFRIWCMNFHNHLINDFYAVGRHAYCMEKRVGDDKKVRLEIS